MDFHWTSPVHFGRQLRRLRAAEVLPHRPAGQFLQPPAQPDHRLNPLSGFAITGGEATCPAPLPSPPVGFRFMD